MTCKCEDLEYLYSEDRIAIYACRDCFKEWRGESPSFDVVDYNTRLEERYGE
jgi:hypothetical protein